MIWNGFPRLGHLLSLQDVGMPVHGPLGELSTILKRVIYLLMQNVFGSMFKAKLRLNSLWLALISQMGLPLLMI